MLLLVGMGTLLVDLGYLTEDRAAGSERLAALEEAWSRIIYGSSMILTGLEADYFLEPTILIFLTPEWPTWPGDAPFVVEAATALVGCVEGVNLMRLRASLAPEDGLPLSSALAVFSEEFTMVVAPDVFH